jgi:hypothetical protein
MSRAVSGRRHQAFLRPIQTPDWDEAVTLLTRGFPDRERQFWLRGLERQASLQTGNYGYFLDSRGVGVGIMLTLRSQRQRADGTALPIVNLSSWYIEPAHRWRAPTMLRAIIEENDAVITDLTPLPHLYKLNTELGLSVWSAGKIIASTMPWAILPGRRGIKVLGAAEAKTLVSNADTDLLGWHDRNGCIAAVLCDDHMAVPLVFRSIYRRGIHLAQLIYAESRKTVINHLPSIMRFLAGRGIFLLSVDALREDCPRGAYFRPGPHRFWKGPIKRDRLDYAYSELVVFDLA